MSGRGGGYLNWPSPVLDSEVWVDPYVETSLDDEGLAVQLASGATVEARFGIPVPGILRVRIGTSLGPPRASPVLTIEPDHPAAELTREAGGVRIAGNGVEAYWPDGGELHLGAWRRKPLLGLIGGSTLAGSGSGRLIGTDGPIGWMETAHLTPDAAVYGGGESFQGPNLRGRMRRLVNVETHGAGGLDLSYLNVPLLWSDAGWGLLVHTSAPVRADVGSAHSEGAALAVEGNELDFFVLQGTGPEILRAYHTLTGMPGRFPDWAFGVWTSRCSYLSAKEIDEVLDAYQKAECPVDVVHVDAWVEGNVVRDLTCNWTADRDRFPEGWGRRLRERGVRLSLWHNPYILAESVLAKELAAAGFLVRETHGALATTNDMPTRNVVDFTHTGAVAWWADQIRTTVRSEGNEAFKPDFAEEVPEGGVFSDGRTGRELRNEYAVLYQRTTHEALRETLGTDAVALFCRSGTAGAQRYPCHWVGDSPSTWDGLVCALRACLSLSLSGFGIVGSDVGGFWTPDARERVARAMETMTDDPYTADVDPELYARWTQLGAFSPVMRFHGTGRREPFAYPEPARSVAIEACRLRRRLRSYLVTAAEEAAERGVPMMRPMPLAYPDDRGARDADLQYLLGPDILVAPILERGGRRTFYVPHGAWEPLWGLEHVEGPGWITINCPLNAFPVFSRAGTAIP